MMLSLLVDHSQGMENCVCGTWAMYGVTILEKKLSTCNHVYILSLNFGKFMFLSILLVNYAGRWQWEATALGHCIS